MDSSELGPLLDPGPASLVEVLTFEAGNWSVANQFTTRNPQQNQKRNLQPSVPAHSAYSASPSQLTLPSDIPSSALGNPYQQNYTYAPAHQDPNNFAFPQQPAYRPPNIYTQNLPSQPLQQQPTLSPVNSRKRRASEIELPGSSSSNASAFAHPSGLSASTTDVDSGLGLAQSQLPSPVVKKGRTNTPWTPAEEQRLKTLRDAGASWSEIAKTFPARTEGSVKKHWYKVGTIGPPKVCLLLIRAPGHALRRVWGRRGQQFRPPHREPVFVSVTDIRQTATLLQAIKDYENNKWKVIGKQVGKPAKVSDGAISCGRLQRECGCSDSGVKADHF